MQLSGNARTPGRISVRYMSSRYVHTYDYLIRAGLYIFLEPIGYLIEIRGVKVIWYNVSFIKRFGSVMVDTVTEKKKRKKKP